MGNLLEVKELKKIYGKGELSVEALKSLNFSIEEGKFYVIIGRSGSGKSTLLHLLGGFDKPTGGDVILEGKSLFSFTEKEAAIFRRRRIGFVFQAYNLLPEYTALDNIRMPLYLDQREIDMEYEIMLLKKLRLIGKENKYPAELSGGENQRVAIARALITKPAIVLADEPTGNLDARSAWEVLEILQETCRVFHQTLLLVTHDLQIARNADEIWTLEDGKLIFGRN
ncbi:MAG: ABC transporter ATP-binding protein [Lachnospiraceae bacterium]|nr:ABC transporter ATP-binding protein [Lachnospiraceae bacterium]